MMNMTFKQHSALIQSYLECQQDLTQFLAHRTGSLSLASDLVHDLYLKLCQLRISVTIKNQRAYLFRMAANLAIDHARLESRRRQILEEGGPSLWISDHDLSPEHHALVNAELRLVMAELAKLSKRARKVLYLSRYEGKYQADIAAELGISITTVFKDLKLSMSAISRARQYFAGERRDTVCYLALSRSQNEAN